MKSENSTKEFLGKRVMIVDEDRLNIVVLIKVLNSYKVSIDKEFCADDLLKRINEGNVYDLIIIDDMMPYMSGTEVMKKIKSTGYSKPIIVLTSNTDAGEREKYLSAGFDDYMAKPIDLEIFDEILEKHLD